MKKNFTLAFLLVFSCFVAKAQVPDFFATDLNDSTHMLYADYLDQGTTTILDFSATWCGPCWAAHTSHVLEDVYKMLGPDGTGDLQVFMLEADADTSLDDLYMGSANSWGNWVEGTSYPIIHQEGPQISSDYGIAAYPTINLVCSDGNIAANLWSNNWSIDYVLQQVLNCKGPSDNMNDARVLAYSGDILSCGTANASVVVNNDGQNAISNLEFTIKREGVEVGTHSWTGNIASNTVQTIDIGMIEMEMGAMTNNFTVEIAADDDASNNMTEFVVNRAVEGSNEVTIRIEADQYTASDPTTYEIVNSAGETVFESGAITPSQTHEATYLLLDTDCYEFRLIDGYGDGNSGQITISDDSGNTLFDIGSVGGSLYTTPVSVTSITVTGTDEIIGLNDLSVVPNVTSNFSSLQFNLTQSEELNIVLVNQLGQNVLNIFNGNLNAGYHNLDIDLMDIPSGQYFVNLQSKEGVHTEKLIKH